MEDNRIMKMSRKAGIHLSIFVLLSGISPMSSAQKSSKGDASFVDRDKPDAQKTGFISDDFSFAAVGDLIYTRPLLSRLLHDSPQMVQLLRSADVLFGNFEDTALDLHRTNAHPQAESGGNWLLASPFVPEDLHGMGFKVVSRANNHATDWGVEGLRETDALLDAAHLLHAGTGNTLSAARAPQFLDTALGRISLVSFASTFTPMSRALDPVGEIPGRAGLNALRTTSIVFVSKEKLEALKEIQASLPGASPSKSADELTLLGTHYRLRASEHENVLTYKINSVDEQSILKNISQGRQTSDFEIAAIHTHEPGNKVEQPPTFLQQMAHEAIDHGADVFVGHGPHRLRGIEIYKGKPIFYSLGNFFFMEEAVQPLVSDLYESAESAPAWDTDFEFSLHRMRSSFSDAEYYESVIAINHYSKGKLSEIQLYPVDLNSTRGDDSNGIPHLASPEKSLRILKRLQDMSLPMGTKIQIQNSIGLIRLNSALEK